MNNNKFRQSQNPQLRGRGALGTLVGIAAGTALLGTAVAINKAMRRQGYGMTLMMGSRMMPPPSPMGMGKRRYAPFDYSIFSSGNSQN